MHISRFHKILPSAGGRFYKCKMAGCSTSFSSQSLLKLHEDVHNNTPRFRCVYCQFATTNIGMFSSHMNAHYGEIEHKCNICGYVGSRLSALKDHLDIHNETKYKCTICSTVCGTRMAHKQHVTSHHDIHEEISKYRVAIQPEVTEKDMKNTFPNRKKN